MTVRMSSFRSSSIFLTFDSKFFSIQMWATGFLIRPAFLK